MFHRFHSPFLFWTNHPLLFYCIRIFIHLFVVSALVLHQFLFPSFTDPHLTVSVYSLGFAILFIDSFCLFFYRENQKDFSLYLLSVDAVFLSFLVIFMGFVGLFFVFFLVFILVFSFSLLGKMFESFSFLLYLSFSLPLAFLWEGDLTFESRWPLLFLSWAVLGFIFCFSWGFRLIFNFFGEPSEALPKSFPDHVFNSKPLALDLSRKLKPFLNSLVKYFPEKQKEKEIKASFFKPEEGRKKLKKLRNFISDFIDFSEPETESLLKEPVDLKLILKEVLEKLKNHEQRPEDLKMKIKGPESFRIRGSMSHLKRCFEHILINAFSALKNQTQPEVKIHAFAQTSWAVLEFLDNGHGINEEDMKKIFDPLFSGRFELGGLGLPYIRKIIKAHKGQLHIESSTEGTKVCVKFPLIDEWGKKFPKVFKKSRKPAA